MDKQHVALADDLAAQLDSLENGMKNFSDADFKSKLFEMEEDLRKICLLSSKSDQLCKDVAKDIGDKVLEVKTNMNSDKQTENVTNRSVTSKEQFSRELQSREEKIVKVNKEVGDYRSAVKQMLQETVRIEKVAPTKCGMCQRKKDKLAKQNGDSNVQQDCAKIQFAEQWMNIAAELQLPRIVKKSSNSIVVRFPNPLGTPDDVERLELQVELKENEMEHEILSIKASDATIHLQDLIDDVIENGLDLMAFLSKMKQRWFEHFPFYSEICLLRNKYAIDWLPRERTLQCIFGKAHIVCMLTVPKGYPHNDGDISLIKVTGSDVKVADLKPSEPKSISNWLDYLSAFFA